MPEPPISVGPDHVHPHAPHTGRRWLDLVIAISAITISLISLFVAVEHGQTERKLVAANSWPFVVYDWNREGYGSKIRSLDLMVRNSGVGPARIQSVILRLDGRPVRDHGALLAQCCGMAVSDTAAEVQGGLYSENGIVGVLSPREIVHFLVFHGTADNAPLMRRLDEAKSRIAFTVCYCSVLDECWLSNLKSTDNPKRVRRCEATSDDYRG